MRQILNELPYSGPGYHIAINSNFKTSLVEAVELYSGARREALSMLYKTNDLKAQRPAELEADFEEVAASCGHFSYSLLDAAEDLQQYLDVLEELQVELEENAERRSWQWLSSWIRLPWRRRQANATINGDDAGELRSLN